MLIIMLTAFVYFSGSALADSPLVLRIAQGNGFVEIADGIVCVDNGPFVLMRSLAAGLGGDLTWIESTKESVFTTDRTVAVIKAGQRTAYINGQEVELSSLPDLSTGRIAISVKDLALLGLKAGVDFDLGTVTVAYQRTSVSSASFSVEDGRVTIIVEADGGFECSDFILRQPDRVVVDIHDAVLSPSFQGFDVSYGAVQRVRAAMNRPGVVRVVVDLNAPLGYTISYEPGMPSRLAIRFNTLVGEIRLDQDTSIPRLRVKGDAPIEHGSPVDDGGGCWHIDMKGTTAAGGITDLRDEIGPVNWVKASQPEPTTARLEFGLKKGYSPIVRSPESNANELLIDFAITVSKMDVFEEPGCTVIQIVTSGPVEFKTFRLRSPERIGVDLPGVWAGGYGSLPVESAGVEKIRFAQFTADVGRIVLDLQPEATRWAHSVEISADRTTATIRVGSSPIYGRTVMLDPGHGGSDPGTVHDGLYEKEINLDIALRARDLLVKAGATVVMTREDDSTVPLGDRPRMANEVKPDAFLSIHCNSVLNVFPCGTETYYYNMVDYSQELATQIHYCLLKEIMLVDRKVRRKDYYVLKETQVPAVLVEVGYMSTSEENEKLRQPEFRQKAAQGLVNGLAAYFDSDVYARWRTEVRAK